MKRYIIFQGGLGRYAATIAAAVSDFEQRATLQHQKGTIPVDFDSPVILVKGSKVRRYLRTYRVFKRKDNIVLRPAEWYEGQRDDLVGVPMERIHEMDGR